MLRFSEYNHIIMNVFLYFRRKLCYHISIKSEWTEYMKKKVLLGLSGGVDSAVSAALLKAGGYEVTGCCLRLSEGGGENSPELHSARNAAERLGIELVFADYRELFRHEVEEYFAREYFAGRTPNPCIRCNPTVKFRALCAEADKISADFIATGHYAKVRRSENGRTRLCASPSKKDQSYFLYRLTGEQLDRVIFPLGDFISKEQVREKGLELGLMAAKRSDSQEICFIPDGDYSRYICEKHGYTPKKGNFIDIHGNIIGTHEGIIHYTAGQRKGLGAFGEPMYVKSVSAADNTVMLCRKNERMTDSVHISDCVFSPECPQGSFCGEVKVRNTAAAVSAEIRRFENGAEIKFSSPVIAPSPGQSAVIYSGGVVEGGGIVI